MINRRGWDGSVAAFALLCLVFSLVRDSASSEQAPTASAWPMFRGEPALLGVSPVVLPKQLELLWSFKTQGPVKSSAAIASGRIFIGSDDGYVYALDLKTGTKLWVYKTEGPVESSPLVL